MKRAIKRWYVGLLRSRRDYARQVLHKKFHGLNLL